MRTDVRKTRNSICLALLGLIDEKPYDDISIREIVARADVSRSSFYNHFTKKDDVIYMIIDKLCDRISGRDEYNDREKFDRRYLIDARFKFIDYCLSRRDDIMRIYKSGFGPEFERVAREKIYEVRSTFEYEYIDENGKVALLSEGDLYEIKTWTSVHETVSVIKILFSKFPYVTSEEFDKMIEKARQMDMTGNFYKKKNQ